MPSHPRRVALLLIVAAVTTASAADLSKGRPPVVLDARVGANIRLGDDPSALPATQRGQAEPHIARSAANPDVLLATAQEGRFQADGGALDIGYMVSRDGGLTWTRGLLPELTMTSGGPYFRATDPVAATGPNGELYINYLASIDNAFGLGAIAVSRSLDNGVTWSAPLLLFQSANAQTMPDKNWLAVNDYPTVPFAGRLVATWTNFTSNAQGAATGNNLVCSLSSDRGMSWNIPVAITPVGSNDQGTQPVFLPDGSLAVIYVSFLNAAANQFSINCKVSTNGGFTFPATATTVVPFVAGWDDPQLRDGVFLPSVAVARTTGDLFVTYTALVNGSPRVLVTKSSDKGATWTTPQIVSDQPAGVSVMNPAIAVTPDGKSVSVVFMDKRNAADGANFFDIYAAEVDGGTVTRSRPNMRLSNLTSDIRYATPTSRGYMLGDYLGVVPPYTADQPFVAIWCDTRTGDSDPFTIRYAAGDVTDFFAVWQRVWFSRAELANPATSGVTADPDGDGLPNAAEQLFLTNPRLREDGSVYAARVVPDGASPRWSGPSLEVSYRYRLAGNYNAFWQQSADGITWGEVPVYSIPNDFPAPNANTGIEYFPFTSGKTLFLRQVFRPFPPTSDAVSEVIAVGTDARLVNLSTRGQVLAGASQLIGSLVTRGGDRTLLVRAVGPSLSPLAPELSVAGDPSLRFSNADNSNPVTNADWNNDPAVSDAATRTGAFPLSTPRDAALLVTRAPGSYSAIVSNQATGGGNIGLVEIYDASTNTSGQMVNLSTRGEVGSGNAVLIAGVVIRGTQPRRLLIRAVGPSLTRFNVGGALLTDPVLTIYSGNTPIAQNDDWEIGRSSFALSSTAVRVGAFALDPASRDAALLVTLPPGTYTAVVSSADGGTGIALVEIYDAD